MYEIFDVTGKTIKTGKINSVNSTIYISDLNEGIYYIQFNHTNETIKFVKMNWHLSSNFNHLISINHRESQLKKTS